MKLAVIGSNMVDLTAYIHHMPAPGETLEAPDFSISCGGKGANQAVAAALCGAEVTMVSKVGSDLFADNTIENLKTFGIDTRYVTKASDASSGIASIFVDESGQNRILIVKGANDLLAPTDIDAAETELKACAMIILQLEVPLATVYHAIDFGRTHGVPVLLNPAPATKALDITKVCACDFFVPNETELSILTGLPMETLEDVEEAAKSLLVRGLKNIIVTLGGRGALWMTQKEKQYIAPYKVTAVDTTGAGDAFIGCFASEYAKGGDVLAAMKKASAFAALSVTHKGTQLSYPTQEELAIFLQKKAAE